MTRTEAERRVIDPNDTERLTRYIIRQDEISRDEIARLAQERDTAIRRAEVAEAELDRGWREIESAPKEPMRNDRGPKVLLWWPHWCTDRAVIGYWTPWHGGWRADEALSADGVPPLAWRPLPSPPTIGEG